MIQVPPLMVWALLAIAALVFIDVVIGYRARRRNRAVSSERAEAIRRLRLR